jgi:uncharacterized protein YjbI with pentapeptide repeats
MSTEARNKLKWVAVYLALVLALLVLSLLMILKPAWEQPSSVLVNDQLQPMDQQQLQDEKLRQEILKLQLENEKLGSFWELLPSYATFVTALVAVIGVMVTIWRQINERELDRKQREDDSRRRLDEKFTSIVSNLGSESSSIQASAAVSIITFLRPEYKAFHDQVFMILLANLKIQHDPTVNDLLIQGFEKAIRIQLPSLREKDEQFELDLSRSFLHRVDLSGLDLSQADLGFAQLRGANLSDANLHRVRGMEANLEKARLSRANLNEARFRKAQFGGAQFHGANLVSADLKETDLKEAQFHQASMQSAHLEKANLSGAKFEQANLNDAFFRGATVDAGTLKSILKAFNWQKAHFDEDVKLKLEELAEGNG